MNPSPVSRKDLIKISLISITVIIIVLMSQINDRKTKIVFCDVGQGDGAYIRVKNKIDILIDSGPDKKILECLGKFMPFWDKKIELIFISHHDKDHYGGLFYLIDRYRIGKIITVDYRFDKKKYKELVNKIKSKKINYYFVYEGDKIEVLQDYFRIYWPPIYIKTYDSNDYSLILVFQENGFKTIFTGDASPLSLNKLSDKSLANADILKIPHHGSKNGLTKSFLDLANPRIAVISVGKNNSYGHPSKQVLDMLKAKNIQIKRTDIDRHILFKIANHK